MPVPMNKTALVTGGSVRLGRAICLRLAAEGYQVVVHFRSSKEDAISLVNEITENGGQAKMIYMDLLNEDELGGLIRRAGALFHNPISLLVNNASIFENDHVETFTRKSFDQHMNAHVYVPAVLAQQMLVQDLPIAPETNKIDAQIINLIDQRVRALTPNFFSYTLSKSALWTMTQTLAQELGPRGIRVNAIGPGPTLRNARQSEEDWQQQNKTLILRSGPSPEDIAQAVSYLINAKSVTGQMIAVDGGQHLAWETPDVLVNE